MRRLAAVVVSLLLTGPASADAQPAGRITLLATWVDAVETHEPGVDDEPAYAIAGLSNEDLRILWLDVQTLVRLARCPTCGTTSAQRLGATYRALITYSKADVVALREMAVATAKRPDGANDLLKRAAIVHGDIAMHLNPESVHPAARSKESDHIVLRGVDGRQEEIVDLALHWDVARALLSLVGTPRATPAPQDDPTVKLWYRATLAHMQDRAMHDVVHFNAAVKLFAGDADVQFQNGCLHETLASARVQGLVRDATLPSNIVVDIKSDHAELQTAERHFRRALELGPGFAEARLRLGRVLMRLGRHAEAVAELRQVATAFDEPELQYYAALFAGGAEAALGNHAAARAAYERASALFPRAQSPLLGLSHLARELGDRTAALQAAQRLLDLPAEASDRLDPLWIYPFIEGRDAAAILDELYRPFRHATP